MWSFFMIGHVCFEWWNKHIKGTCFDEVGLCARVLGSLF